MEFNHIFFVLEQSLYHLSSQTNFDENIQHCTLHVVQSSLLLLMTKSPVIPETILFESSRDTSLLLPTQSVQCPSARRPCPVHAKTSGCRTRGTRGPTAGPAVADSPAALGPTFPHSRELCSSDILEQLSSSAPNAAVMVSAGGGEE